MTDPFLATSAELEAVVRGIDASRQVDLVLVNSPLANYDERPRLNDYTLPSLGLGYIATYAHRAGFNVGVLDVESLGLGIKEAASWIGKVSPRWVGMNLLAPTYTNSKALAQLLPPDVKVLLGGHHAKAMPADILADQSIPRIDAMVLGEAETRVAALLESVDRRGQLPGVHWRTPEGSGEGTDLMKARRTKWLAPDLDELPVLDRRFFANDPFRAKDGRIEANMVGSRGCPYNCSFCGAAVSANPDVTIRARSARGIADELELLAAGGVNQVRFVDDLFLAKVSLIESWIGEFSRRDIASKMQWDATGRINIVGRLTDEHLANLRNVGLREIALGVESGNDRMLERIDKRVTSQAAVEAITRLLAHGISVKAYYILGFPTETLDQAKETLAQIDFLHSVARVGGATFRSSIFEFRPYPGTPEWERLRNAGYSAAELTAYADGDDMTDAPSAIRDRDEFNFSVGIQFAEYPLKKLRAMLQQVWETEAQTRSEKLEVRVA